MDVQDIVVTPASKTIDEKIKTICLNYMQLMMDCANDEMLRKDFLNNRRQYLNEKVGMKIPDNALVLFDSKELRWPSIYIKTDDENIVVQEGKLAIEVIDELASGEKTDKTLNVKAPTEVEVMVHEALKKCRIVIKLPFFDTMSDVLGEIKFSDDSEVILTTCC